MNIKPSHHYRKTSSTKQTSKKHNHKSIKPFLSPSSKNPNNKQCIKEVQNMKPYSESQKTMNKSKIPPVLKRQITQDSIDGENGGKNIAYEQEVERENMFQEVKKKKCLKQSKKINSDQQSTNVYRYNKQSADFQLDPYKISSANPFNKEKSIKPCRDLSITLMCNIQPKPKLKITEHSRNSKNQSPSIHDIKAQIHKKIESFKSLTKLHQEQSEYFTKKVGISNEQQKRLQKIQLIEINSVKNQIFYLRDEIENILPKAK